MTTSEEKLWTMEDLANWLQVRETAIRYWLRTTDLPHYRIGRHIRFSKEQVKEWLVWHTESGRDIGKLSFVTVDRIGSKYD